LDEKVEQLIKQYWKKLKKKANVVGFSGELQPKVIGGVSHPERKACRIYVKQKGDVSPKDLIPKRLDIGPESIETDVIAVGELKALDNKAKRRPICAGISTMHKDGTACTINGFFRDKETQETLVASNNHCYALENKALIGDPVLQPGPYDGGKYPDDQIGTLEKYVEVKFDTFTCPFRNALIKFVRLFTRQVAENKVDIAFAKMSVLYEVLATYIGEFKGKRFFHVGDQVTKSGRTTEQTEGVVIDTAYSGYVTYSRGMAFFTDCYLVEGAGFSAGGDSGSPVFDMNGNYGGALFAGSDQYTIVCKVENIEKEANVELITSGDSK